MTPQNFILLVSLINVRSVQIMSLHFFIASILLFSSTVDSANKVRNKKTASSPRQCCVDFDCETVVTCGKEEKACAAKIIFHHTSPKGEDTFIRFKGSCRSAINDDDVSCAELYEQVVHKESEHRKEYSCSCYKGDFCNMFNHRDPKHAAVPNHKSTKGIFLKPNGNRKPVNYTPLFSAKEAQEKEKEEHKRRAKRGANPHTDALPPPLPNPMAQQGLDTENTIHQGAAKTDVIFQYVPIMMCGAGQVTVQLALLLIGVLVVLG